LGSEIEVVSSDYVKFEVEKILDPLKRKDVRGFEGTLSSVKVNPLDALHVSAACMVGASFLLT